MNKCRGQPQPILLCRVNMFAQWLWEQSSRAGNVCAQHGFISLLVSCIIYDGPHPARQPSSQEQSRLCSGPRKQGARQGFRILRISLTWMRTDSWVFFFFFCLFTGFKNAENPWTEEPGRLQSMGWQRVGHD